MRSAARLAAGLKRFLDDRSGSSAVEYAVVICMLAIVAIGIASVGEKLGAKHFDTYASFF